MMESIVRMVDFKITNFKNVNNGSLNLINKRKNFSSSILGLYGQNGSGKTALIDAFQILKLLLCGRQVPDKYADYINVNSDCSKFHFHFQIDAGNNGTYEVYYDFSLKATKSIVEPNMPIGDTATTIKAQIYDEVLSYSFTSDTLKMRKSIFIDTSSEGIFSPAGKYELLFGKDKELKKNLLLLKALTSNSSQSFIFSREFLQNLRNKISHEKENDSIYSLHKYILDRLVYYGNCELFIIETSNSGVLSLNVLPIAFRYKNGNNGAVGSLTLQLNGLSEVPEDTFIMINDIIKNMNTVLTQIVPGLTIGIMDMGLTVSADGVKSHSFQLMSNKNNKQIPLCYESEGIKKIISILQLFIVMYNVSSITIAIDELDSGIFEYLLGELLRILSEKGKGQLIFTSHNLRPLETIDRGFIAFTTTNPDNRYIRLSNIKENNNLRDFYFRDIVLGEQNEEIYDTTNNSEIALAFREVGDIIGS